MSIQDHIGKESPRGTEKISCQKDETKMVSLLSVHRNRTGFGVLCDIESGATAFMNVYDDQMIILGKDSSTGKPKEIQTMDVIDDHLETGELFLARGTGVDGQLRMPKGLRYKK